MGTKHGYTEKRCVKCGKVKPRDAYPKRGGLACTECQKPDRRKEAKAAYDNDMKTEKGRQKRRDMQKKVRDRKRDQRGY